MPFFDPESMGQAVDDVLQGTEARLFGRRTWDVMAGAWPARAGDPFADRMNAIPKYVVSRTLSAEEASSRWNHTPLLGDDGDAIEAVRSLKADRGDAVTQVMGSASLARQLVENDLVDEYRLMLEPILLGGGKSIYPSDGRARSLELVSAAQEDWRCGTFRELGLVQRAEPPGMSLRPTACPGGCALPSCASRSPRSRAQRRGVPDDRTLACRPT